METTHSQSLFVSPYLLVHAPHSLSSSISIFISQPQRLELNLQTHGSIIEHHFLFATSLIKISAQDSAAADGFESNSAYFFMPLRVSTITSMNTIHFQSDTQASSSPSHRTKAPATFSCTAADLAVKWAPYSISCVNTPSSDREHIMLAIGNYISIKVMYAELEGFKMAMQDLMTPSAEYLAAMADDPAS